jgi:hypothetical protein
MQSPEVRSPEVQSAEVQSPEPATMTSYEARITELEDMMSSIELATKLVVKEKKRKKEKNEASDEDKPKKKRTSGYIVYCGSIRSEVKERLAAECINDKKPKPTDVMKELGRLWQEVGDDEKAVWNEKAQEIRDNSD